VRDNFKKFEKYGYWNLIDANQEKDCVHRDIVTRIEELLEEYSRPGVEDSIKNFYPYNIGEDLFTGDNL
jgi:hypothetical protein